MAGTVLLVEDEPSVGELVRAYLTRDGYRVIWVRSGEEALTELDRHQVRMVLLDIGLPGKDGFDVCREMRAKSQVPILMLTARDEEPDRVVGLEVGADDYLAKPFSPRELVARMKAIFRRTEPQEHRETFALGDVTLDRDSHDVTVAGKPIELTAKEFDLLAFFMANAGVVVSRDLLLDRVWGQEYPGGTRTVDVHVAQLRRKLGRPDLIRTLRGSGYKAIASCAPRARRRRHEKPAGAAVRCHARRARDHDCVDDGDRRRADAPSGRPLAGGERRTSRRRPRAAAPTGRQLQARPPGVRQRGDPGAAAVGLRGARPRREQEQ